MTITVPSLDSSTVHFVLDHICPLSGSLPPEIISVPLRQRHHFLSILPDDPVEYLAWPCQNRSHVVDLLQTISLPSHDLLFPVNYTADPENTFAYARITPDITLIFLWNAIQGWQYHNVALMPFPSNSYPSLTALYSADDFLPEQQHHSDNSYWDSYDHPHSSLPTLDPDPSSEDAYWAQYSTVQGSGDSTLPSPVPRKKEFKPELDTMPERIIVPFEDLQIHHVEPYNPLQPPSPDTLARRLKALSSSSGANSPPFFDDSPTTISETPSPNICQATRTQTFSSPSTSHQHSDEPTIIHPQGDSDSAQNTLRDSIRSLYQLWKLSRPDRPSDQDKTLFLSTVYQVIDQL